MSSLIIGTAGHVDHGKTMLIKALTGKDTDRLEEEKKRGVSIDLGFASFLLPDGKEAGIIDVPGHERFIHNMLAGAGSIDLMVLVIDVNEGIMPQTREHMSILDLLGTKKGIIALTKVDTAEEEWCEIVEEEVRKELKGTFLEEAPCIWFSAYTGQGLPELKEHLYRLSLEVPPKDTGAPLRIPVDRCFTVAGFGTVITGTLLQGSVSVSETVEVLPPGISARVRNIQVFSRDVERAEAGQRVALNLSGLEKEKVERGSVVCAPGFLRMTSLMDVSLELLPGSSRKIRHMTPVHFYLGTARVVARVALLDREELKPGERAPVQVRSDEELVTERSDRFIIRSYSPMTTIGGGIILDPFPPHRYRRYRRDIIQKLQEFEQEIISGKGKNFVWEKIEQLQLPTLSELEKETRMGKEKLQELLSQLENEDKVVCLGDAYTSLNLAREWENKIQESLDAYHAKNPLFPGLPRAELKRFLPHRINQRTYEAFWEYLSSRGKVELFEDKVRRSGFQPEPTSKDREIINRVKEICRQARFQPPGPNELAGRLKVKEDYLHSLMEYLVHQGEMVRISEEYYLLRELYEEALEQLRKHFEENQQLTLAEFRDILGTSRKYVQPLLEHIDREKITRRVGDYRVLLQRR